MEPLKIKKLVLNKETIANLSGTEQNHIRGGGDCGSGNPICVAWSVVAWSACGAAGSCAQPCTSGNDDPDPDGGGYDSDILEGGDCFSNDYEIMSCEKCPDSEYYCRR